MDINKIYNEDCLEGMKRIPDKSIDCIICDLPYGVTNYEWDKNIDCEKLIQQYRRICKRNCNVLLFCQMNFGNLLMNSFNANEFSHALIWEKSNKTRHKSVKNLPLSTYEIILCFRINKYANSNKSKLLRDYFIGELNASGFSVKEIESLIPNKSAHHWFRYSSDFRIPTEKNYIRLKEITNRFKRSYSDIRSEFDRENNNRCVYNGQNECDILKFNLKGKRLHPTQKPLALIEYLVKNYSNEGDTILDNCMGSGTTAIACINTRRKFIGFEIQEKYVEIAEQRLKQVHKQIELQF